MNKPSLALKHLEDAEATLLSFLTRVNEVTDDDDDFPQLIPALVAAMRSIARAAGIVEAGISDDSD